MNKFKDTLKTLLRKSEKYTKTDMVYLASGGFWLTIKKVLAAAIAFGVSIAFANLLPQETFGQYKYVFSFIGILSLATLPGMGKSITRAVALGYDATPQIAIRIKIFWGTLGSLLSTGIGVYYYTQGNLTLALSFIVVALFLPFVDTFHIFNSILTGKRFFKVSILYEIAVQATYGGIIVLTLFLTNNLVLILGSYFFTFTITRYIAYRIASSTYITSERTDFSALSYGKHLSAMRILDTLAGTLDSILLWHFVGAVPVAIYSFSKAIPNQLQAILENVVTIAFPKFARRKIQKIRQTLKRRLLGMMTIILCVVTGYIFAAPHIFGFFFPQYVEAIFPSQIFALSLLFFPKKILGSILSAHAKTKKLYIYSTISPIVNLALVFVLVPLYGVMGAISAELIARAFSLLLMIVLFKTTLDTTPSPIAQ